MMKRRALSTVVGAVFFVIVMASTISYVAYSMDLIDNLARNVNVKQDENLNRQNEKFDVLGVTITPANKFNITLHNSGNLPIKITRLFVENTTDPSWNATKFDINTIISPGEIKHNIGNSLPLQYLNTESYLFNLVTERGNLEKISVNSGGNQALYTNLYAIPEKIPTGFTTMLSYTVVNNSTGILTNIQPVTNPDITYLCSSCTASKLSGPDPTSYPALNPGGAVTFTYYYKVSGENDDQVQFNATLVNAYPGDWDIKTVTIGEILQATQAGTSVTAGGLGTLEFGKDILILHAETDDTPDEEYQLHTGFPEAGANGLRLELDTTSPATFFTNNGTQNITIDPGNWNASLQIQSEAMPRTLISEGEDMIFHFEDGFNKDPDNSEGSSNRDLIRACSTDPVFVSAGHHNKGAYQFNGVNCFESKLAVSASDDNDIGKIGTTGQAAPVTTSLWFKTSGQVTSEQYLVNWEGSTDYYRISLVNPGYVKFTFKTADGDINDCTTINEYDDSNWHHVVAKGSRASNQNTCDLWVDLHGTSESVQHIKTGNPNDTVDVSGKWIVGANQAKNNNFFSGQMDDIIHWDDKELDITEATELAKTNYGDIAHQIKFKIDKTDKFGSSPTNLYPETTVNIPFFDPKAKGDDDDTGYYLFNHTMNLPSVTLNGALGERIKFIMSWGTATGTWIPLDIDIKIDDETISPYSSLIQLPAEPSNPIPGYLKFDNDNDIQFWFNNVGPNGVYLTHPSTRIAFNGTNGEGSFAAFAYRVNSTSNPNFDITPTKDSIYFPAQTVGFIMFRPTTDQPNDAPAPDGNKPTPGTYDANVWILGYDDQGKTFERSFNMGVITIVE